MPTVKPTSVPTAVPSAKPTVAPTSTPVVVVPGPAQTGTVLQAELFPRDGVNARTVTDTNAVGKQAMEILKNFSVKSTLKGPVKKLIVRARSNYCSGYGHINVKINGNYVMDVNISSSSYRDFVSGDLSYLSLKAATYPIEIIYNTAYATNTCTRSVVIDQITLQ